MEDWLRMLQVSGVSPEALEAAAVYCSADDGSGYKHPSAAAVALSEIAADGLPPGPKRVKRPTGRPGDTTTRQLLMLPAAFTRARA